MPQPPNTTQSTDPTAPSSNPIRNYRPLPAGVTIPGNDRRPPTPTPASVDNYDIPTLRRKPLSDQASLNAQKHIRSISHPFPSLFGSKRTDKKSTSLKTTKGLSQDTVEEWDDDSNDAQDARTSAHARFDRQPITGKCMTCDSTVRWPQGLKVFRCTTCLTINDLEPFVEAQPSSGTLPQPSRSNSVIISLERTRSIIDECFKHYFQQRIEGTHGRINSDPSLESKASLISGTPPQEARTTQPYHFESSPTSPNINRDQSWSQGLNLSPHKSRYRDDSHGPSLDLPVDSRNRSTRSASPGLPFSDMQHAIFRPLENHISSCFTGCATLNSAFFTVKPQTDQRPRNGSDPPPRRQEIEPISTPTFEPELFISDLDAKTLLLGDFAENGSWWSGNNIARSDRDKRLRERSPDRWTGVVNVRSPRINWIELAEWYRLINNAGDTWRKRWHDFRVTLDSLHQSYWDSIPFEQLHHDIIESQNHLQRSILKSTENLLKRPRRPLKSPEDCRFLFMLLSNPTLYSTTVSTSQNFATPGNVRPSTDASASSPTKRSHHSNTARRPGSLGHHSGIIKRIVGLIANLSNDIHQVIISWFSRLSDNHFSRLLETVGSFTTYRLSRQPRKPVAGPVNPTDGLIPSFSDSGIRHPSELHAALEIRPSTTSMKLLDGKPKLSFYAEDWQIRAAARVMALLFQANTGHNSRKRDPSTSQEHRTYSAGANARYQAHSRGQIVPISAFYNSALDYADLVADFEMWETTKTKFTFCQYPFFLSIYAKIHILEHDAKRQMEVKAREAFFDSILSRKAVSQYLVLKVRRNCLVEDSLKNVSEVIGAGGGDVKKGLRIDFIGEEGIDAGGLRKEWFLLLVREIFDPHHGLFVYDEDSQCCYFNPFCFESSEQFFLVGVLLGLAIYNSTILDVAFPPFVFKKMLSSAPPTGEKLVAMPKPTLGYTLDDLAEFRPALAKGLRQLLEFDGDVQETFCRDFVAEVDRYGELVRFSLCPGGASRPVTNANRREFVDLYVHYLLDTAVARQYEPFKRGFFTVCGGNALTLFRPEEIELLVRGSDERLDITSLRAVATYEGWPKDGIPPDRQPQVMWFWEFFQNATPQDQRRILSFITGSDRIPAMGATNLTIKIVLLRQKDTGQKSESLEIERLPTARTCFNTLNLYQYSGRERLEAKLWMAVTGSEGFGLK